MKVGTFIVATTNYVTLESDVWKENNTSKMTQKYICELYDVLFYVFQEHNDQTLSRKVDIL